MQEQRCKAGGGGVEMQGLGEMLGRRWAEGAPLMSPCYLPIIMPFGTEHHAKLLSILGATPFPYSLGFSPKPAYPLPAELFSAGCSLSHSRLLGPAVGSVSSLVLTATSSHCFSTYGSEVKYHPASPSLLAPSLHIH